VKLKLYIILHFTAVHFIIFCVTNFSLFVCFEGGVVCCVAFFYSRWSLNRLVRVEALLESSLNSFFVKK
jgi:hypothetical protein